MKIDPNLKDESLLLLGREGHEEARSLLAIRYYAKREFHGRRASPELFSQIDPIDYGGLFFKVYLDCELLYSFESKVRFRTFLEHCLGHAIGKEFSRKIAGINPLTLSKSLDTTILESGDVTLHDVLPDDNRNSEARAFLEYFETLEELQKLPQGLDPLALKLVSLRLDGYDIKEACDKCTISYQSGRNLLRKYRSFASKAIKKYQKY